MTAPSNKGFLGTESWLSLVQADRPGLPPMEALGALSPEDVDALLGVFETGSLREEFGAFLCLRALLRRGSELGAVSLGAEQRRRCIAALETKATSFLSGERGASEWLSVVVVVLWCAEAPDAAADTLVRTDVANLDDPLRHCVFSLMAYRARARPDVRAALESVGDRRPDLSGAVREALEQAGIVAAERLASWSQRWIRDRDPEALSLLYHRYVENNGSELTLEDVKRLFGEGPRQGRGDMTLQAESAEVYLEFNAEGRLTGWHGC